RDRQRAAPPRCAFRLRVRLRPVGGRQPPDLRHAGVPPGAPQPAARRAAAPGTDRAGGGGRVKATSPVLPTFDDLDRPTAAFHATYDGFEDVIRYLEALTDRAWKPVVLAHLHVEDHPTSTYGSEALAAAGEIRDFLRFLDERL